MFLTMLLQICCIMFHMLGAPEPSFTPPFEVLCLKAQYKHQNPRFNRLRPHTTDSNVLIIGAVKHSSVKLISC
ncbi:hypothetical protein B0H14DRAFT_2718221 [Mycena olivaceomarginata]|nr:hypothetical protein B0H14DRAFT_2718221 [Mycena olivaceomarginata]